MAGNERQWRLWWRNGSHAAEASTCASRFFSLLLARFHFAAFSPSRLVYPRYDYVDEDTSWHFAIGNAKSGLSD